MKLRWWEARRRAGYHWRRFARRVDRWITGYPG